MNKPSSSKSSSGGRVTTTTQVTTSSNGNGWSRFLTAVAERHGFGAMMSVILVGVGVWLFRPVLTAHVEFLGKTTQAQERMADTTEELVEKAGSIADSTEKLDETVEEIKEMNQEERIRLQEFTEGVEEHHHNAELYQQEAASEHREQLQKLDSIDKKVGGT